MNLLKDAATAENLYDGIVGKLCVAAERLNKVPASFRHEQFDEAAKALESVIGLIEDLQYEAAMTYSSECEQEKEEEERAEYERLKAKFG